MNVLIFQGYVDPGARSGRALLEAWPTLPGVAGAVAAAGCSVHVVVADRRDETIEEDGVTYHFVAERVLPSPRRWLGHRAAPHPVRSLRAAAKLPSDVIHLHGFSFPRQARALRRLHPSAALLVQDHADRPPTGWRRRFLQWGYQGVDGAAFTALDMAFPFVRARVLPDDALVFAVVEGSSRFRPGDRSAARREMALQGDPVVAWVGNLEERKDPITALEVFRRSLDRLPGAVLHMVFRGGPLEPEVRRRVSTDPALASRVRLLGSLDHSRVETFLRGSDLLLAPSRFEGSGYAVIEALACGTPVVASAIPAHRAIVGEGDAGFLASPGDPVGLAHGLAEVLRRGETARAAARRRFDEALSFRCIGLRLEEAYRRLMGARVASKGVVGA